jgi:hypothetical protein
MTRWKAAELRGRGRSEQLGAGVAPAANDGHEFQLNAARIVGIASSIVRIGELSMSIHCA